MTLRSLAALLALLAATPARAQWEPVPLPPDLSAAQIALFGFLTALGPHVYASTGFGTFDGATLTLRFVYVSHDSGVTWAPEPAFTIPASSSAGRVGRPAAFNGAVYIPFLSQTNGVTVQTVARTTDGTTWTFPAGTGLPSPAEGQFLGVTRHQGALYVMHGSNNTNGTATTQRSDDDGETWTAVGAPRTPGFLWTAGSRLLLGRPGTVLTGERSTDGGLTWTPHQSPTGTALNIVDAALSTDGVAITLPGLRSTDGGATWANAPGATGGSIAACGSVFVVGSGSTVVISTDGGLTWAPWANGLPAGASVSHIACADEAATPANALGGDGYVYAVGTGGMFRRPTGQFVASEAPAAAAALALTVAPNPTAGAATLRLALAAAQTVRVTLTDVLGREALRLDRTLGAGPQALPLDVAGLAPGVYVARIVSPEASASVRLTVTR